MCNEKNVVREEDEKEVDALATVSGRYGLNLSVKERSREKYQYRLLVLSERKS
ncbi:MAG: hypothetical protein KKE53_04810 [Proteobacteria bacterium]|nr:hypothetical protein [Pseudomonadota bacterium]